MSFLATGVTNLFRTYQVKSQLEEDNRLNSPEYIKDSDQFNKWLNNTVLSDKDVLESYAGDDKFMDIYKDPEKLQDVSDKIRKSIGLNSFWRRDTREEWFAPSLNKSDINNIITENIIKRSKQEERNIIDQGKIKLFQESTSKSNAIENFNNASDNRINKRIQEKIEESPQAKIVDDFRNGKITKEEYDKNIKD